MAGAGRAPGRRRWVELVIVVVLALYASGVVGDAILTMGNRDWSSYSKVRRDFATWSSWDSSEGTFGDGIQQQILFAVDSPRYPQGESAVDQHGFWLLDAPIQYVVNEDYAGAVQYVMQVWVGGGFDSYGSEVTIIKLLEQAVSQMNGWSVAEGMLEDAIEFTISEAFTPVYAHATLQGVHLIDAQGRTWLLPMEVFESGENHTDYGDEGLLSYDIQEPYPSVDAVCTVTEVDNRMTMLAADSEGAPMLFVEDMLMDGTGFDGALAPSIGGNCIASVGFERLIALLWNPASGTYALYDVDTPYGSNNYTASFFFNTSLTQRNCGASTATSAPIMINGGDKSVVIFCQGAITIIDTGVRPTPTERTVPGYIHGVVWASLLLEYDVEGAYQFEEVSDNTGTPVSWQSLRESQSQVFWLTSSNTLNQIHALMESDLVTHNGNLQVSNVLQWIPDNISAGHSATSISSMTVFITAASEDFLFLSVSAQGVSSHSAIVVIDVRTVESSREYAIVSLPDGRTILQLAYDGEDNCLYGLQQNMMNVNGETHLVEFSAALVRIPLSSDASATAETIVDLAGWESVNPDLLIRTVSPHQSLEDVPSAYATYAHAWVFIDGLYGELVLIDTRDGSLFAMDVDWEAVDFDSRFALSMTYDSEEGVLYAMAPLQSTPVFMEVVAVSMATTEPAVLYSDAVTNEFILALDCATCFIAMHPGSHSLVLRSQFSAVVIPLDDGDPVLTVLDSGDWDFFLTGPTVSSPASIFPFSLAIPFDDYPPVFGSAGSTSSDVVLVTSDSSMSSGEPVTSLDNSSHFWLFTSVAGGCAIIVVVVIAALILVAKRASHGRARILAHATPVFDDEISDRDL